MKKEYEKPELIFYGDINALSGAADADPSGQLGT